MLTSVVDGVARPRYAYINSEPVSRCGTGIFGSRAASMSSISMQPGGEPAAYVPGLQQQIRACHSPMQWSRSLPPQSKLPMKIQAPVCGVRTCAAPGEGGPGAPHPGSSAAAAHDGRVTAVQATPDGLHWLTAATDSRIRLWAVGEFRWDTPPLISPAHCKAAKLSLCMVRGLLSPGTQEHARQLSKLLQPVCQGDNHQPLLGLLHALWVLCVPRCMPYSPSSIEPECIHLLNRLGR